MEKLTIVHITPDSFPPDARIEREIRTLIKAGYRVLVYASDETEARFRCDSYEGAKVIYCKWVKVKGFCFIDWRTLFKLLRIVEPCIIHVHNPQLFPQVMLVAKKLNAKIVYDNHELWSMFAMFYKLNPILKLGMILLYFFLELIAVTFSHAIITISEDMKNVLCRLYRVNPSKVFVLENFEEITILSNLTLKKPPNKFLNGIKNDSFVIGYLGGTEAHRGLTRLLQGLRYLPKDLFDRVIVLIIGPVSNHLKNFLKKSGKELVSRVILTGYLPFTLALSILRKADITVLPYESNAYSMYALPNKVCHYLYLKKPLIATRLHSLERYFSGSIYFVDKPDPRKLADAIQRLYTDSDLRRRLGDKGYEIVMAKNNWENVSKKLINCYHSLLFRD
jgi:glycosyltransferase involved in cell wall biosynthesis